MARSKEPPDAEHSTELERLRAEIERLRREVERQRDMARRSGQAAREREETLGSSLPGRASLVHARRRLDGQLERRSIRLANEATRVRHGIATRMRRAALVAAGAVRPASKQATAGPEEARAFAKQNIAASAGGLATGPLVSLIVEGDSEMLGRLVQRTATAGSSSSPWQPRTPCEDCRRTCRSSGSCPATPSREPGRATALHGSRKGMAPVPRLPC